MKKLLHTNVKPSDFKVQKIVKIILDSPLRRTELLKKLRKLENTWGYSCGGGFDPSLYVFFIESADELYVKLMTTSVCVDQLMWSSSLMFTCYEFTNDEVLESK